MQSRGPFNREAPVTFSCRAHVLLPAGNAALMDGAVRLLGNWVGGTVTVDKEGILFQMSALDKLFQLQTRPLLIRAEDVLSTGYGRLFRVLRTVDVGSRRGPCRFWTLSAAGLHGAVSELAGRA